MIYNNKEYDHICIGFSSEELIWINTLNRFHNLAVGIWIRALLTVLNRGNQMSYNELLRIFTGHNLSRQKVIKILGQTQCFVIDDTGETISCTEETLARFLPIGKKEMSPKTSLANDLAKEKIPKPLARTPANTEQEKRNIKRTKNKSSFAELSSNAATPEEKEFYQMMLDNCPRVCQMEEPLTYYEYQRIVRQGIPLATIREVLQAMQNHRDLLRKYVSANLTLRHWIAIRQA